MATCNYAGRGEGYGAFGGRVISYNRCAHATIEVAPIERWTTIRTIGCELQLYTDQLVLVACLPLFAALVENPDAFHRDHHFVRSPGFGDGACYRYFAGAGTTRTYSSVNFKASLADVLRTTGTEEARHST